MNFWDLWQKPSVSVEKCLIKFLPDFVSNFKLILCTKSLHKRLQVLDGGTAIENEHFSPLTNMEKLSGSETAGKSFDE